MAEVIHSNVVVTNSADIPGEDKIWAEASTDPFWPDKEFQIKAQVNDLRRKFHDNRYLRVKHLPTNVTKKVSACF